MPLKCVQCHNEFPHAVKIDGKRHVLSKRKRCPDCLPLGQGNKGRRGTLSAEEQVEFDKLLLNGQICCITCNLKLPIAAFGKTKNDNYSRKCKECTRNRQKLLHQSLKQRAVDYKGGQCIDCSFSGHTACFDFHHLNPKEKDFEFGRYKTWPKVQAELDKCVLLCANCHRYRHAVE